MCQSKVEVHVIISQCYLLLFAFLPATGESRMWKQGKVLHASKPCLPIVSVPLYIYWNYLMSVGGTVYMYAFKYDCTPMYSHYRKYLQGSV